jgi:hypothetical protein
MNRTSNPLAFPRSAVADPRGPRQNGSGAFIDDAVDGMELRDYFAAKAMQAVLSNASMNQALEVVAHRRNERPGQSIAVMAYQVADAMLAERSKKS